MLVKKDEGDFMGKVIQVQITSSGKHFLKATVNKQSDVLSPGLVEPLPKGVVSGIKKECVTLSNASTTPLWLKIGIFVLLLAVILDIVKVGWSWTHS